MAGRKPAALEVRFWEKVNRSDDMFGCWEWTATLTPQGYGSFSVSTRVGKNVAHRVSWELANGPIPAGMIVCHRCDNRRCVNPAHLFLGTHADNTRDMHAKGRGIYGEDHPGSKLTRDSVLEIRRRIAAGEVQRRLAREFDVSISTISNIKLRKVWNHMDDASSSM